MERSQFGPLDRPGQVNRRPIQASRRLPARVSLMQVDGPDGWRTLALHPNKEDPPVV